MPATLAVFDDGGQDLEELAELLGRDLGHQLAGLTELHREHLGETRLVLGELRVSLEDGEQALGGRGGRGSELTHPHEDAVHGLFEETLKERLFTLEVQVDGAVGDAGFAGHVGDARDEEAFLGEDMDRSLKDAIPLIRCTTATSHGPAPRYD